MRLFDRGRWRHRQMRRAEYATVGGWRSIRLRHRHARNRIPREMPQGTKLALIAKGRLKELLAEKGLRVIFSGAVDKTQTHRPLINIYRTNGEEIGKKLLQEGFARPWNPKQRNDWCD
ncbi:nuclease SNase-like domain-containing protein [Rhizobium phage RHph_Y3_1]|nr:nuclease SNase-like domain-containing protein [Rhizobium phage RHph_Y3_1]